MSSEIDLMLYRPLKDGKQYDKLIPGSTCERVNLGDGMTDYTVEKMADWIKQFAYQMAKVAPLMQQQSLQDTCTSVHEFAYDHFAYKADLEEQFLRSPACAWFSRHDGLDCKSYSIIASCILVNLGITHYIRRVRQPGFYPELWTHVYIVVPVDQNKGDLSKGYYYVDGTVDTDDEPEYIEKSDTLMQHTGLAGAYQPGLNGINLDQIKNLFSTSSILKSLSCMGGTYHAGHWDHTLRGVTEILNLNVTNLNNAVKDNSPSVMEKANAIMIMCGQIKDHGAYTATHDWKSACSKDTVNAYRDLGIYIDNIAQTALTAWIEKYFTVTYTTVTVPNNTFISSIGIKKAEFVRNVTIRTLASLALKPGKQDIVMFEITTYTGNIASYNSGFDPIKMFASLVTPLVSIGKAIAGNGGGTIPIDPNTGTNNPVDNTNNNNNNNGSGNNSGNGNNNNAKVTQASTGMIVGVALVLAGVGYYVATMPDTPTRRPAAKKAAIASTKKRKV